MAIPIPPAHLIEAVVGRAEPDRFVASGNATARFLLGLLREQGLMPGQTELPLRVMDFGCGCGRVARAMVDHVEITGCDLLPEAVEWCRANLPGHYFVSNEHPPLPVADASFDALYAISVLTHLDEPLQDAWLSEWQRIVRPGGILLVSYRGEGAASRRPKVRERAERIIGPSGFGFEPTERWRGVFPDCYGAAFHSDAYVREHWGRFFEVLECRPATASPIMQDLAVLRRRSEQPA